MAITIKAVANTKTYDATTSAAAAPTITSGSLQGSNTANFTEAYATKNVGTGLALAPSGTVNDGNSGDNYTYTFLTVSTGVITQAPLTITAVTNTKVYDGTTSAAGIPTVSGLKGSDTITNLTETYATATVGTGKTLNVTTYTVNDGNGGNDYTVTLYTATGTITPAAAYQLVVHTQPSATATAGVPFTTQPVIYEEDQFGNLETGDNTTVVTAALDSGTGPLQGTSTATVSGGVATFTNLADDTAETLSLLFTSGSLTSATSNNIVVSAGVYQFPSTAGNAFVVTPNTANTILSVNLNGNPDASIPGGATLSFTGTGGTVTINGEAGPNSTNVFTINYASVAFNAGDALGGTTIDFLATGLTRYVDAQGTTNTFNIQGAGASGPAGSLVGDSGTNTFVFSGTGKVLGSIQGAGASTLNYAAYSSAVTSTSGTEPTERPRASSHPVPSRASRP